MVVKMITDKKNVFLALILFCTNFVFAKPEFSLSLENSFLTGKANLEPLNQNVELERYFEDKIKGGQIFLTFRSQINNYFSIGIGSGASINKVKLTSYSFHVYDFVDYEFALPYIVPVFTEIRGTLPVYSSLYLYCGVKIGGAIGAGRLTFTGENWLGKYEEEYDFSGGFFC